MPIRRLGLAIGEACAIIGHLNGSLDHEAGGEIAGNLSALYDFVIMRLTEGNLHNDPTALKEALDKLNIPDDMGVIIRTAGVGRPGAVIALMAALTESSLRMLCRSAAAATRAPR